MGRSGGKKERELTADFADGADGEKDGPRNTLNTRKGMKFSRQRDLARAKDG
jgi:hypothetical protein